MQLCPRFGLTRGRDRDGRLAGALASADVGDRVQARPVRFQDDPRFLPRWCRAPSGCACCCVLTVVDIRAVGPGVWNGWKRQLLTDLYESAEEVLRLGHKQKGRSERIAAKQEALARRARLGRAALRRAGQAPARSLLDRRARRRAGAQRAADRRRRATRRCRSTRRSIRERGATLVTVYAADHPGLFYRIAGAIHRRRRQHHRRAHPHHARRHGARQFPGPGSARPAVRRCRRSSTG